MHVRAEVVCNPLDPETVKTVLRRAGEDLALSADSVSVRIDPDESRVAILEFEMRRTAQYKVVDDVFETIKFYSWDFYEDCTVQFSK
jgi:hypothetical protein